MNTVDKMLIKGIRSFDPENKNVVTFFRPLTLIVGANRAGKTTIIECLKVSCTGELPPNARYGHNFIHDPKVAGETETKAQIKLRFKTAAGKDVVCIRSFQLTQKASKMEYKAIESVLQTINPHTGEKVCLSYRCADMDREIPALMDVQKFYHQCDPEKENLCLYGLPNETWEVNLPVEEVPPELPEPALGINFARDGMQEKDWISLVAVHSDSWLISVAFYFGARFGFGKNESSDSFSA